MSAVDLADAVIAAWKTSNRVTLFLFENLSSEWSKRAKEAQARQVGRRGSRTGR